jgi:hypothetical protein
VSRLLVAANVVPRSTILGTLMLEAVRSSDIPVLTKAARLTSQKTALFLVTAAKTSNLTCYLDFKSFTDDYVSNTV